jgi:hypothetical protein
VHICEWIYEESVTLFKYCKVSPFRRCDWSETRDQVDATNDRVKWNDCRSAVSSLHWSRHLIHKVFAIRCGWKRAEPFDVSEMVRGSNVLRWEHIVDVFAGYLKYDANLGNTDTWGFELNNFEILPSWNCVPLGPLSRTTTVSKRGGMFRPCVSLCSGRAYTASNSSESSLELPLLVNLK